MALVGSAHQEADLVFYDVAVQDGSGFCWLELGATGEVQMLHQLVIYKQGIVYVQMIWLVRRFVFWATNHLVGAWCAPGARSRMALCW